MIANAVLEIFVFTGCEAGLFGFIREFNPSRHNVFTDNDLHWEVKVASILCINALLNDAGVNSVFTCFNLALERDFKFDVSVFFGGQVHDDNVAIGAV